MVADRVSNEAIDFESVSSSLKDSSIDLKNLWSRCNDLCRDAFDGKKKKTSGITK